MTELITISGVELEPLGGRKPQQLVVLLHGLGADANDLMSIGAEWQRKGILPDAVFASPNAPFPCDMAPFGYQWFSLQDRSRQSILGGISTAKPMLDRYLDELLERHGLTDKDMAVAGFSQGAMMAFYTMPRRKAPCAAVVGYSGMLLDAEGLKADGIVKPQVLVVHGDADNIVPANNLPMAYEGFRQAGFVVEKMLRPGLGHSIDTIGLMRGGSFIRECFLGNENKTLA